MHALDDVGLMRARADVLFRYDARGRMLAANCPNPDPAPRVFLARAGSGYLVRFGATVSDAVAEEVAELVAGLPAGGGPAIDPAARSAVAAVLERWAPVARVGGGPAYRFPPSPASDQGGVVAVRRENVWVVRRHYAWLEDELADWSPAYAVVRDGAAVAVCLAARIGPVALEAGVHTQPAFRGRGYAGLAAAAWGRAVRAGGRIPLYSTGWDNAASQAVARKLGLTRFGADATWA